MTIVRPSTEASSIQDRFWALLEPHQAIVHKVANSYCRNAEDRRDLVQEMTTELWRAFPRYDSGRRFSTWLYRIALNVAISHVRRASYRQTVSLPSNDGVAEPIAEPTEFSDERIDVLHRFIQQLDDLNRALLLLYLDGHSHRETAEILGISEANVGTKIGRVKERIRSDPAFTNID